MDLAQGSLADYCRSAEWEASDAIGFARDLADGILEYLER